MTGKRTSKTLLAVAIALQASLAQALGLGDISLRSALDEPLDADVRLRGVGDLGADQIIVSLASAADFERAGVDRLYSLTEMRFEVELLPNGDGRVHIRTERPVREPYLDFVLEVRWPTGRVLREYTVLLDLPTTTPTPAPEVSAPARSRVSSARQSTAGGAAAGGGTWSGGDSYAVQSGDTLWSIASRTRPSGVSVQQMMVALQRENPDAFIRGNMNLLRAGAVLRVPSGAAVSQDEALGEIAAQGEQWRSGGTPLPKDAANRAPTGDSAGTPPADGAYLELAAGTAGGTGAATGGVDGGTGSAPLQEQLSAVQENLSAKERENAELQSRVSALEEQVQNYEKLVELKSEGGAAAQQAAGSEAAAVPAEAAPAPEAAAAPAPAPSAPAEEPGLLARLMDNSLAMAAALGVLVAGAVAFLFLRRRREEATYGAVPESAHELRAAKAAAAKEEAAPVAPAPERAEPSISADTAPSMPAFVSPAAAATATVSAAPEPEHRDPISEAEIFVAYGRTERALEVLRKAIDETPERTDVRLKLMEMLAEQEDHSGFLAEYDQLAIVGDAAGERAARDLLMDRGLSHWLAEIDQPAGVQSSGEELELAAPPAEVTPPADDAAATDGIGRLDIDELAQLDTGLHLDTDLASGTGVVDLSGSVGAGSDEDLALELGDLDFGGGLEDGAAPVGEIDLSSSDELGALGELELDAGGAATEAGTELAELAIGDLELPSAPAAEPVAAQPAAAPESVEDDGDLGLLEGSDEIETKLELARAYVDMGDLDGARDILDEVVAEGSTAQRDQANALLERLRGG